jgi:hypothetical protein
MGNQLCRNMSRWLVQNPDCVIETANTLTSYGMSGAPDVGTITGRIQLTTDVGFVARECFDRTPGGRNGFLPGAHSSKDPPKRGGAGPVLRGRAGEQRVANRVKNHGWEVTEQVSLSYTKADGSTSYVRVDMVARAPNSNTNILIEVKSGGGRLSPHQREGFEQIYLAGGSGKGPRARTADITEIQPGTVICVVSGDDLSQIDSLLKNKGC